ncbi:hypothetical protein AURDEDRAFT_166535 [Auricularia subglabra TFB-10046 SS5]|nr:hypothetical protein AURDEDRAFT_166535 [Auricularia subglabra TFB-10046 SS5]
MLAQVVYDCTALRALLESDFLRLSRDVTEASQLNAVIEHMLTSTKSILLGLGSSWNTRNPIYALPDEILAACFASLPFPDRLSASHVSRAWRHASLAFPAVWSQLDISSSTNGSLCLLEMTLSRAGHLPIELSFDDQSLLEKWASRRYGNDYRNPDYRIRDAVGRYAHRLRSLTWHSLFTDGFPSLTSPAPLLESLTTNLTERVDLEENFLGGVAGRLRTLKLTSLCLPRSCPALSTVTELHAQVSGLRDHDPYIHLRALFPRIKRLHLRDVMDDSFLGPIPEALVPRSLVHLSLYTRDDDDEDEQCDLARHYLAWRTDALKDCELWALTPSMVLATPSLRGLFAEANGMDIILPPDDEGGSEIALVDAQGRRCRILCSRHHATRQTADAYRALLDGVSLDGLHWLSIDSTFLIDICRRQPRELVRISLHLHRYKIQQPGPLDGATAYAWESLQPMAQLAALFPKLESVDLTIHAPDPDNGRELMSVISALDRRGLPTLRVHGLPDDVLAGAEKYTHAGATPVKVSFESG